MALVSPVAAGDYAKLLTWIGKTKTTISANWLGQSLGIKAAPRQALEHGGQWRLRSDGDVDPMKSTIARCGLGHIHPSGRPAHGRCWRKAKISNGPLPIFFDQPFPQFLNRAILFRSHDARVG